MSYRSIQYFQEKLSILHDHNNNEVIVVHVKISYIRNNFPSLIPQITSSIIISIVTKTKLDESFQIYWVIIEDIDVPSKSRWKH